MFGGIFGFQERSGEVVIAVLHFDLQFGISDDGVGQIAHDVRSSREKCGGSGLPGFMLPVPVIVAKMGGDMVIAVVAEFQILTNIHIEGGGEGAGDGRGLRIVIGAGSNEVVGRTRETRVQTAGGETTVAL